MVTHLLHDNVKTPDTFNMIDYTKSIVIITNNLNKFLNINNSGELLIHSHYDINLEDSGESHIVLPTAMKLFMPLDFTFEFKKTQFTQYISDICVTYTEQNDVNKFYKQIDITNISITINHAILRKILKVIRIKKEIPLLSLNISKRINHLCVMYNIDSTIDNFIVFENSELMKTAMIK